MHHSHKSLRLALAVGVFTAVAALASNHAQAQSPLKKFPRTQPKASPQTAAATVSGPTFRPTLGVASGAKTATSVTAPLPAPAPVFGTASNYKPQPRIVPGPSTGMPTNTAPLPAPAPVFGTASGYKPQPTIVPAPSTGMPTTESTTISGPGPISPPKPAQLGLASGGKHGIGTLPPSPLPQPESR
jgi:hypothetical protein